MSDPDVKDLADEIEHNPRAFAVRFAELVKDVSGIDQRAERIETAMRRGTWLAITVLAGVVVNLALMLQARPPSTKAAETTARLIEHALTALT